MKSLRVTSLLFVALLLVLLAALWWGLGFAQREQRQQDEDRASREVTLDERGEPQVALSGGESVGEPETDVRAAIIGKAGLDAGRLFPEIGEEGELQRFWFVSDREVYVEYRREGEARVDRMAFFVASGDLPGIILIRQALYGAGEAGQWELLEGDEVLFAKPLRDLYERDTNGEWVKRN